MLAHELSQKRQQWWVALGSTILQTGSQVDFPNDLAGRAFFGDRESFGS